MIVRPHYYRRTRASDAPVAVGVMVFTNTSPSGFGLVTVVTVGVGTNVIRSGGDPNW